MLILVRLPNYKVQIPNYKMSEEIVLMQILLTVQSPYSYLKFDMTSMDFSQISMSLKHMNSYLNNGTGV